MKLLLAVTLLCIAAGCVEAKTRWFQLDNSYTFEKYTAEFGKNYTTAAEAQRRRNIFEQNLARIIAHNKDTTKTWKEGVNSMTDWTEEEFQSMLGYDRHQAKPLVVPNYVSNVNVKDLPPSKDWRDSKCVTAVKNQGGCGSCWSFGAAETLESYVCLKSGNLMVLSEQNILDCTPNPQKCGGTGGCGGATAQLAYDSIRDHDGIELESTYPYVSGSGRNFPCKYNASRAVAQVTGYEQIPSNKYDPLMDIVANRGPVSISVAANRWGAYEEGVFDGCDWIINHAVQLVGYGTDTASGQDYYLIRNSWGASWGEQGYVRLLRRPAEEQHCGTDTDPGSGSGCAGGPPTVTVCGTCGILYDNVIPTIP